MRAGVAVAKWGWARSFTAPVDSGAGSRWLLEAVVSVLGSLGDFERNSHKTGAWKLQKVVCAPGLWFYAVVDLGSPVPNSPVKPPLRPPVPALVVPGPDDLEHLPLFG